MVTADVSVDSDVAAYVQAALHASGGVDVLLNNAGVAGVVSPLTSIRGTASIRSSP